MLGANLHGGFLIWRQVDVWATSRIAASREDRIEVVAGRAPGKAWRRQAQIDANGMPLGCSNAAAVL